MATREGFDRAFTCFFFFSHNYLFCLFVSDSISMSYRVSGDDSGRDADPAIKLFGRTIPLTEPVPDPVPEPIEEPPADESKDLCKETANTEVKDTGLDAARELEGEQNNSSSLNNTNEDESQTSSQDVMEKPDSKPEQDQSESDASVQEKVLKKPDKILPCPRCNSLDTKFCYYNNYNVNQPRHFCKNCQRYWTAGGTMRNVPVGAGRRKTKSSAAQYRLIREGIDANHHQALSINGNGAVLNFGSEAPLCESMPSALNLDEKKRTELSTEEPSCASSVTASDRIEIGLVENAIHKVQNGMHGYCNGFTPVHPLQYYPGPPWVYPILAAPAFCTPTIPVPFVPPAFWPTGAWTVPWAGSNDGLFPSSSSSNNGCSGNGSPNLGKHSRDASLQGEDKSEKSLWVPKTLRIDDPNEAAKSSIWATLGIKPHEGSMFKAFPSKFESKGNKPDALQALHANPAALSRSQSFQEST